MISVDDLAVRLKINAELAVRLLRACPSTHFSEAPGVNHYAHNARSCVFLSPDNGRCLHIYNFTGEGVLAIPLVMGSRRTGQPLAITTVGPSSWP